MADDLHFFPFKGDLFEPARTFTGNSGYCNRQSCHQHWTFFFSPKNKKTFLWITFVQGGASETIQRKLLNFPREDEQRCVTSFGPYDDLFLSFFPLPKFVFEIRNTIHNRRRWCCTCVWHSMSIWWRKFSRGPRARSP